MGEDNGGRWDLEWKFIDCPAAPLQISTQGGNKWYALSTVLHLIKAYQTHRVLYTTAVS